MQTSSPRFFSSMLASIFLLVLGGCGVHAPETQPATKAEESGHSVAQPQMLPVEPPSLETFDASLDRA